MTPTQELGFWKSMFWDDQGKAFSMSRFVMFFGAWNASLIVAAVVFVFIHSYFNRPVPVIAAELLPWAGGAAGIGSVGYGMNKWSNRSKEEAVEEFGPDIPDDDVSLNQEEES